jgi:O-antigen ligase
MNVRQNDPEMESMRAPRSLIIIGALAQVHVQFVGQIFLSELFLYAIWVFRTKHFRFETGLSVKNSMIEILQKLLICVLAAQLITDILRGINFIEMAKGSSLILFTIFNLKLIYKLTRSYVGVVDKLVLGYALSYFVGALIQPNEYFESYPWKFGFAYGSTILLFILLQKHFIHNKIVLGSCLLIFVVINLALDARSLALIVLIAMGIYLLNQLFKKSKVMAIVTLIASLILTPTIYTLYASEASKGTFGLQIQQKYLNQTQNTNNLFYGGRTDVLVGLSQVKENPIVGQGSYAKISANNREEIFTEIVRFNPNLYPLLSSYKEGSLIPIHSILFQFWVWYGIVGALPWLWCLYAVAWRLRRDFKTIRGVSLINCYLISLIVWDILFSPFGADRRFSVPLFLIALLIGRSEAKDESAS